METYNALKNLILDINQDLKGIIREVSSIDGLSHRPFEAWAATTSRIQRQLTEEVVRVAVVGAIKSGKSTLINALFGGDYLRRGAGVVTSIVTRIRPGGAAGARLEFKTWDEINSEMNQALTLLPAAYTEADRRGFDITRERDRIQIKQGLSGLTPEQLLSDETRDPNIVLVSEYLKGYDRIKDLVSFDSTPRLLADGDFQRQKELVGDQSLAIYLKDVVLDLVAPEGFGENVEMADCQGSDSPNPLHLAMIQDYLLQTHLIVYVLSSRTGLRQADIKFLTIIKKMGLLKNIIFVVNCDLSEHDHREDLIRLVERVREELGMILPQPKVFAFSALYNLFEQLGRKDGGLARKDLLRLEQWGEDPEMTAFSDHQTDLFFKTLLDKISSDRFELLVSINIERVLVVATSLHDWAQMNYALLSDDTSKIRSAFAEMEERRQALGQVLSVIKDTLTGTTQKLKKELTDDVDSFFDPNYGATVREIVGFVSSYDVSIKDYENDVLDSGFLPTLYKIFQVVRDATNRHVAESINPKLVDFVRVEEEKIKRVFEQVAGPYSLMIGDALDQHRLTAERLGISRFEQTPFKPAQCPSLAAVKSDAQLRMPPIAATMQYSTRIKTEAVLRLGFYNTLRGVRKLLKKSVGKGSDSAVRSLEESVRRIKEEIQESLIAHLADYKENFKYQYLFKLVDEVSNGLYESIGDKVRAFAGSLSDLSGLIESRRVTREEIVKQFSSVKEAASALIDRIKDTQRAADNTLIRE